MEKESRKILIVDDMELNRAILGEAFRQDFEILEAENGREALELLRDNKEEIVAVLLDLIMPVLDGYGVMEKMVKKHLMEKIPVFLITAEESEEMLMRGYELGAVDVISKPFNVAFLRRRIGNVIELYRHRLRLESIVELQVQELKEKTEKLLKFNTSMIDTLSTVIEFRDCESGEHVQRIRKITDILLNYLSDFHPEYKIEKDQIPLISDAAAMHDIGKIAIPDAILNKPGRLTDEEFEVMKEHTVKGCEILDSIDSIQNSDLYKYCYEICRYHHERWDGRGYPDRLAGEEIPIWAQIVSLADVYDALVSERVYKPAYSHEKAVSMILNGECGTFNPSLIESFRKVVEEIHRRLYQHITEEEEDFV